MTIQTIKDICEQIFQLESKHDLLDLNVDGVKIWQYLRMHIYYRIATVLGVLSPPHPLSLGKWKKIKQIIYRVFNSLIRNPFYHLQKLDYIVVPHRRSQLNFSGHLTDIYTDDLVSSLKKNKKEFATFEFTYNGFHHRRYDKSMIYMDFISIAHSWNKFFLKRRLSPGIANELKQIESIVDNHFGIRTNLLNDLIDGLERFKINYRIYFRLLDRFRPKKVFLVVGYTHGDLVKAAKDLQIDVIELQHGTFSRYHLGYSFHATTHPLEYFPHSMMVWGCFWKNLLKLPVPESNVIVAGFQHFHKLRASYYMCKRKRNRIIVISQGAIGNKLSDIILSFSNKLTGYEIIYKLHPSEYAFMKDNASLTKLLKLKNVNIANNDSDLYRLFAESSYQIGVFSTAIYEGIGMGCKTLLIDLPGIEYMNALAKNKMVVVHSASDNILDSLNKLDHIFSIDFIDELFGPVSNSSYPF